MEIEEIPVVGKISHSINMIIANFILLGFVALILGVIIPFFPQVLDVLVAALLVVAAVIFFNIAFIIRKYKNRYLDFFK
ncbi:hypothetical protein COU74_02315 [Candidatus Peregrinibacteria bacterium CG10_big_fil_rev_8_21_14_0_10_36_19]|nr:MAG: hypothetical protein COU74_02315 [Candidatus Peregrinibacteria bacterium CG10_big_fil_rev_8_21_14_0_10_36_19]